MAVSSRVSALMLEMVYGFQVTKNHRTVVSSCLNQPNTHVRIRRRGSSASGVTHPSGDSIKVMDELLVALI